MRRSGQQPDRFANAQAEITQVWHSAESAAAHGDYTKLKTYMTPQAVSMVDAFRGAALLASYKPFTLLSIAVNGDTAKVTTRRVDGSTAASVYVKASDGWKIGYDPNQAQ